MVEQCQAYLQSKIDRGEFSLPRGVSYEFAGSHKNQQLAAKTLALIVPVLYCWIEEITLRPQR